MTASVPEHPNKCTPFCIGAQKSPEQRIDLSDRLGRVYAGQRNGLDNRNEWRQGLVSRPLVSQILVCVLSPADPVLSGLLCEDETALSVLHKISTCYHSYVCCLQIERGVGARAPDSVVARHLATYREIKRCDLQILCDKRWLNDEIINLYLGLLQVQAAI